MSAFERSVRSVVTGLAVAVTAASMFAGSASAALVVDLRFSDGTKSKEAAPGNYTVQVWGKVTGDTNSNRNDEGLLFLLGGLQTQQVNGGAVLGNGLSGVTANAGAGLFSTSSSVGGAAGSQSNTSTDGLFDWGNTSSAANGGIKFNSSLNSGLDPVFATSSGAVAGTNYNLITGGAEFLIGSATFTINAAGVNQLALEGGETRLNWLKMTSSTIGQHSHRLNGTSSTAASAYASSVSPANGVTFTAVPEPASLGLMSLALLGLSRRRRSR